MTDDVVGKLIAKEASLAALALEIADILGSPVPSEQAKTMKSLWADMKAHEWPYAEMIRSLRPSAEDYATGPGSQAFERRALQRYGPLRINQWGRVGQLIDRQTRPYFEPLVTENNNRRRGRQDGYLYNMMRALFVVANPLANDQDRVPEQNYRDIGLTGPYFINLMRAAYRLHRAQGRPRPAQFIDVGCGGGTKVFVASSFFEVCVGLEYDAGYVRHARDWMGRVGAPGCEILQGDALDYTDFARFDVIYMFRPIKDSGLQGQLESQILAQARPGTIIVAPTNQSLSRRAVTEATPVVDTIYLAHSTPETAHDLLQAAEAIGPDQGLEDPQIAHEMGFWQPILAASRARGFEPAP